MMPVVWTIPFLGRDIPGYGLLMMIGFLAAIVWAARRAQRSGANPDVVLNCGFISLIAGVVGCRAMYVYHYWDQYKSRGSLLEIAWAIVDVSKGGLEFYGGFILSVIGVTYYLWRWGHSLRWYLDIMAPSSALGLAFGRIGCFLNGCCFGAPTDLPWAVKFPYGSNAVIEQWANKTPGAGLPQELICFPTSVGGQAIPVTRESLAASDEKIAAAEAAEVRARDAFEKAVAAFNAAGDGAARQRAEREKQRRARDLAYAKASLADIRHQMKTYRKSAAELRAIAAQHPSVPVHPTQIYSTITAGLLAMLLSAVYWRRTRDGQVILTLLLVEPTARFLLEMIRADNPTDTLGFTVSQFVAICMTTIAIVGFAALRFLPPRSPRARLWEPQPAAPDAA